MSTPHDPRCPVKVWTTVNGEAERGCECGLIAIVQADERERNTGLSDSAHLYYALEKSRQTLADLRAKVKALPSEYDAAEELHYVVLDDVLALLPEKEKP